MKKKNSLQKILTGTRKSFSDFQTKMSDLKKQRAYRFESGSSIQRSSLKDMNKIVIEVSAATVAKSAAVVLLLLLFVFFLYQISGILVLLFVSFLLAAALDPVVDFMQKRKIPRSLGVLIIYIAFFCI